jgi:C4-dicarboxylate-specific signal transduction histidine kinase
MFVVQVVDRTEQLQAELEIRRQRESLAQAARLGTMGEMAAAIAHELNQPLTAISSYAQACQRMMESGSIQQKDIKEILNKVHAQARRAGRVIQGLRSFVKQRAVNRQPTDLHRVLRDVSMLAELDARAHGIVMQVEASDVLPRVQADPIQLQQVLLNLIRNGVDAMADGQAKKPLIEIRASMEQNEEVWITVTDYGAGISTDHAENLFEPFFTTKKEGMGMGLSLSRSIIEAHGGRLEFSAHPEGGSEFNITLPTLPETDS